MKQYLRSATSIGANIQENPLRESFEDVILFERDLIANNEIFHKMLTEGIKVT
nr:hypothetical protein [Lebetimonas sp. JS138]